MVENYILKYSNPNIEKYKRKLKELELEYNTHINEKAELEKILFEFQHQHTLELGSLILKILKLRKEIFHNDKEKFKEAENDEKQYKSQFNEENKKQIIDLNSNEKEELKKKFRKASVLCHPDKVNEKHKKEAQDIFINLKAAYDNNNLEKVSEILENLEKTHFKSNSDTISEIDNLKFLINQIEYKIKNIIEKLAEIKNSETYLTILSIKDWNLYFAKKKNELNIEYENLKTKLQ